MKIVIEIPDSEVPSKQEMMSVDLHFIDGHICECIYPFEELKAEPCEDEYIKIPKKALKYRTAGMVAYNYEWLKNHFDIERAVICGEQEPCEDAISRQYLIEKAVSWDKHFADGIRYVALTDILNAPSVTPAEKVGRWIAQDIHNCHTDFRCSKCGYIHNFMHLYGRPTADYTYCPNCGAKMQEADE